MKHTLFLVCLALGIIWVSEVPREHVNPVLAYLILAAMHLCASSPVREPEPEMGPAYLDHVPVSGHRYLTAEFGAPNHLGMYEVEFMDGHKEERWMSGPVDPKAFAASVKAWKLLHKS